MVTIITGVATFVVTADVVWFISNAYHKNVAEKKLGSAESKAREIIENILILFYPIFRYLFVSYGRNTFLA